MAYSALLDAEIEVGDPVTEDLLQKIKENFADHETRINSFEANKVVIFNCIVENNSDVGDLTGRAYFTALQDFTVTEAFLQIFTKGTLTGNLEVDILKASSLGGSFASIFSTKPKIVFASASNYDKSANQVFNSGQVVVAGEVLRLDVTILPGGGPITKFLLVSYGEI